ncbi:SOS response-associated peptidase family protein [Sphingopyxis indica]|uniref:Putative SOS response-associated peptidase YedK n=1 Tax=Sphingopyxis indica TaxID=436663 RepID=A0A239HIA0_9SPHN|nr:SOS response-associated peptidase family protein [Sphingopyxis indica]SNS80885.1 Putative SOS response-associated peptidase YedK [Sphingopyxis indica]
MILYRLDAYAAEIAAVLGAKAGKDPWQGGYVTPGRPAPVVVGDGRPGSRPVLRPKLWGVPPPPRGDRPVTSVRNLQSPFWTGTLRHPELRCLIPATAFAGWSGTAGAKRQLWYSLAGEHVFAFAGIHRQTEDWPSFAVLTTEPNSLVERHQGATMPVILHREDHIRWLTADWRDAASLVTPFPSHLMETGPTPP